MLRLVYRSTATQPFAHDQLFDVLSVSQRNNAQANITGLLLHSNGQFFQVLEGEAEAVQTTFERIKHDPRHSDIQMIFQEQTTQRLFSDWSMGFLPTDNIPPAAKDDFNVIMMESRTANELLPQPTMVRLLLKTFQTSAIQ